MWGHPRLRFLGTDQPRDPLARRCRVCAIPAHINRRVQSDNTSLRFCASALLRFYSASSNLGSPTSPSSSSCLEPQLTPLRSTKNAQLAASTFPPEPNSLRIDHGPFHSFPFLSFPLSISSIGSSPHHQQASDPPGISRPSTNHDLLPTNPRAPASVYLLSIRREWHSAHSPTAA